MNISVLGPDVNESNVQFKVDKNGDIRFGLGAIKGVGANAVETIIEERKKSGPYKDIYDFVERNDLYTVNRKNLEGLALAGAFDCFTGIFRNQYVELVENEPSFIEQLIKYGNKIQFEKTTPQQNLFGELSQITVQKPVPPDTDDWHLLDKINKEKELLGIYLTAHPLDRFRMEIDAFCTHILTDLNDLNKLKGKDLSFCGIVKTVRDTVDQWRNKPYMIAVLEDYIDTYTLRLRNDDYVSFKQYFSPGVAVMIKATVNEWSPREEPNKVIYSLKIKMVHLLADVLDKLVRSVDIYMDIDRLNESFIKNLEKHTITGKGKTIKFFIKDPETNVAVNMFSRSRHVELKEKFLNFLQETTDFEFKLS